jgi:hypothetical protein
LGFAASYFRGRSIYLSASLGSTSSLAEQISFFRSLTGSLTPGSGLVERSSLYRSLTGSWIIGSHYGRGSFTAENLQANFNTRTVLSGHSDCSENLIVNCGSSSASFAFLVLAVGVSIFGIYVVKQRRRHRASPGELKDEQVVVDTEGWETKHKD